MLTKLTKQLFADDLAIDITSSRTVIHRPTFGIVINEPSAVATENDLFIAVGQQAEDIRGKTPTGMYVKNPVRRGVIANPDICSHMISHAIRKIYGRNLFKFSPVVLVPTPHHASQAEIQIFEETLDAAGARGVKIISSLLAAAYGAELKPKSSNASIVCNINDGFTEIGIISMNKVHEYTHLTLGHQDFVQAIIASIRNNTEYTIGEKAAEQVLKGIGAAYYYEETDLQTSTVVAGMHKRSSVPTDVEITKKEVCEALLPIINSILSGIFKLLESAKDGMAEDIRTNGITVVGIGATLPRLDTAISHSFHNIKTTICNNPETAVARGAGVILGEMNR